MNCPNKLRKTNFVIFKLQTPDFAWKFLWTVEPKDKVQKYKKYKNIKVQKYKKMNLKFGRRT